MRHFSFSVWYFITLYCILSLPEINFLLSADALRTTGKNPGPGDKGLDIGTRPGAEKKGGKAMRILQNSTIGGTGGYLSVCLGLFLFCMQPPGVSASDWVVPDDPGCGTIQPCIAQALGGDTITVLPGTYNENIDFMGKAVNLRSLEGPETTIIEGSQPDAAVVTFVTGEGNGSVLDGFTIRGGGSSHGSDWAEGIYTQNASPVIRNNLITENLAYGPDGNYSYGLYIEGGSPEIRDNRIEGNGAGASTFTWIAAWVYGIFLEDASPVIENNRIRSNFVEGERWAHAYGIGGSIQGDGSSPVVISKNTIQNNTAYAVSPTYGVSLSLGIALLEVGACQELRVQNNMVTGNKCPTLSPAVYSYGIFIEECSCEHVLVSHNTISDNYKNHLNVEHHGAGLDIEVDNSATLVNNIVTGNREGICASTLGGGTVLANYNDVWNNMYGNYCSGMSAGPDDLSAPPLFISPLADNYRIAGASPCIDSGTDAGLTEEDIDGDLRPQGDGYDMGADEVMPTWSASTAGSASLYGPGSSRLSRVVTGLAMIVLPIAMLLLLKTRNRSNRIRGSRSDIQK